jgi:hypothetical protein
MSPNLNLNPNPNFFVVPSSYPFHHHFLQLRSCNVDEDVNWLVTWYVGSSRLLALLSSKEDGGWVGRWVGGWGVGK